MTTTTDLEALAKFCRLVRRYVDASERATWGHGFAPQHEQFLLAIKGCPGRDWTTIRHLAEQLQCSTATVATLVVCAELVGWVEWSRDPLDSRSVRIYLTDKGERLLAQLAKIRREDLQRAAELVRESIDRREAPGKN